MSSFKIECPDCGAIFLVSTPEALVWERCPSCQTHVWDLNDARMADRVSAGGRCVTDADASANN